MKRSKRVIPDEMPYCVDPRDLSALGVDPDIYFGPIGRNAAGWTLHRKRDAALIQRLQSRRESHGTVQ